jgi:predicted acyltransferase
VDDIVERLRGSISGDPDYVLGLISDAADEIEQLRTAGDALGEQIGGPCRCVFGLYGVVNETCDVCAAYFDWKEARHG